MSMLNEKAILNSKIGIVAHDSGGAHYIQSFINYHLISPYVYSKGPASKIFDSIKGAQFCSSINEIISKVDVLILGSGWESNFEIKALINAKSKVTTITFLDHWTNYIERFNHKNQQILPDYIVVYDKYAYELAKKVFPNNQNILLLKNYYIIEQTRESNLYDNNSKYILFIDEPIRSHVKSEKKYDYDEFTGISFFLQYIEKSKYRKEEIKIRLHPSEKHLDKYNSIIKKFPNVSLSKGNSLVQDILNSKFVVGFESMALVVSLGLNKLVYNIIPPDCIKSSLPHSGIKTFYNEI